jgi:hypothetical protein
MSMEMVPGALLRPGRVSEQRLLSPESRRWWRRSCRTSSRKTSIDLGFRLREALNRRRQRVAKAHTPRVARPRCHPRHHGVWLPPGPPPTLLRSSSRVRKKIGGLGFVSSNSENISYVAFLKHKNSRKQGTSTVASR